jgi:hypothetical protein
MKGSSKKAQVITLQFTGTNPEIVPSFAHRLPDERRDDLYSRLDRSGNGTRVVEPVENCSPEGLLDDIASAGYELYDVEHQVRINRENVKKPYHMVRYTFILSEARRYFAPVFKQWQLDKFRPHMEMLCQDSLWRIFAHSNPLFVSDREIRGERTISVNLGKRVPVVIDGKPVLRRKKDESGRPTEEKTFVEADSFIRMGEDCMFQLHVLNGDDIEVMSPIGAEANAHATA